MRSIAVVLLLGSAACGPIYPQSNAQAQGGATQGGPPGGANTAPAQTAPSDPYASPNPSDPYADPPAPQPTGPQQPPRAWQPPEPVHASPAPVPPLPARPALGRQEQSLLDAHNRVRANHCVAPLAWSSKLAASAQAWADSLRDKGCVFGHSGSKFGENLAAGTSGTIDGRSVTAMWYDEVKLYSFDRGGFSQETGHFTQVVWKGSTEMGCAMSQCNGNDIWVCQYNPPGNWQGKYRENVLPATCSGSSSSSAPSTAPPPPPTQPTPPTPPRPPTQPGPAIGPSPNPGAAPPAPAPVVGLSRDQQALLDSHNRMRANHCAAPLTWSPKLAAVAQDWANKLRDKGCSFGHSGSKFGENLAAGTTGSIDGRSVTAMWYDEVKLYSFPNGGFSAQTGHFTQVVWRGSKEMGCAMSQCSGNDIWVCNYDPPGNWQGKYRENVLPQGCK